MEQKIAGVFRLVLLIALLFASAAFLAPLQVLARRYGWRIGRTIPVLFCRCLCRIVNLRPHFHGAPGAMPRMLAPNHVSWLDIPAIGCLEPIAFIAKREVAQWPILGWFAKLQGAIFIDRSRRRHIPASNRRIAERLVARESVVLFAEGTTGDGNRLEKFRTSHFEAAKNALTLDPALTYVTVQPLSIAYTRRNGLPLGRQERHRIAWYGDMTLLPHLWGMVTGGPIDCDIHFGSAISVTRTANRKVVGAEAERTVRTITGLILLGRPLRQAVPTTTTQPVLIGAETA
jgi:1-acyl-sn-glycerol-3-phosphate acyltransferase